jgi:hypothetical protein
MVIVASTAVGLGIVANLNRLSGLRRLDGYRVVGVLFALGALAWFAVFGRADDSSSEPPIPE